MKLTRVVLAALFAGAAATATTAHAAPAPDGPAPVVSRPAEPAPDAGAHMQTILVKVNELRAGLGLGQLTRYVQFDIISQDWSAQMASGNDLGHRPDFASMYPAGWSSAAENVAMCGGCANADIGAMFFDLWLHSPGHYANMTASDANAIGIGLAYNPATGSWFGTQNFGAYPDPAGAGLTVSGGAALVISEPRYQSPQPTQHSEPAESIPASEPLAEPEPETPPITEPAAIESPAPTESASEPPASPGQSANVVARPAINRIAPADAPVAATATVADQPFRGFRWFGIAIGVGAVGAGAGSILLALRRHFS